MKAQNHPSVKSCRTLHGGMLTFGVRPKPSSAAGAARASSLREVQRWRASTYCHN